MKAEAIDILAYWTSIHRILHPDSFFIKRSADSVIKELLESPKQPFLASPVKIRGKHDNDCT